MSRSDDVERAHSYVCGCGCGAPAVDIADLIAAIRAETFEACAAHLVMRAEQSLPDLVGRISADVLRAGANEIRMLAHQAAKEPR